MCDAGQKRALDWLYYYTMDSNCNTALATRNRLQTGSSEPDICFLHLAA